MGYSWKSLGRKFSHRPGNPATVGVVRWPAAGDTAGSSLRRLSSLQHRIYNLLGQRPHPPPLALSSIVEAVARFSGNAALPARAPVSTLALPLRRNPLFATSGVQRSRMKFSTSNSSTVSTGNFFRNLQSQVFEKKTSLLKIFPLLFISIVSYRSRSFLPV